LPPARLGPGSNAVFPISTATNTAGKPIRTGAGPEAIAITPDGKIAYVVNNGYDTVDTVTPISTVTNTPGKPIKVALGASAIAITPDGKTAYVVDSAGVTPISTVTNGPRKPINVGIAPIAIAITPDGKTGYVVNAFATCARPSAGAQSSASSHAVHCSNTVTPISTATNRAGKPIHVGRRPWGIAITPDGKTAYVACT
jgi:YVTN family beta-propeller protein